MRTTSLMLLGTMAYAQQSFQIHIESRTMNPEEQKKVSAFVGKAHERLEEMEKKMEENMETNYHLRGPPPFLTNFFGPPADEEDEMGLDMHTGKFDQGFHHQFHHGHGNHGGFFGEHGRHHHDHHHGDHGHGFFGELFGPPPPPPAESEDKENRPLPPFFARLFAPPPPRHEDEEIEERGEHHGPHGMRHVEMMCHDDRIKFCSENHHPFFVTRCLMKHAKQISKECREVLPKHPLRCLMMHLLMTCLMMYFCIRVVRLAFRYVRRNQFNQSNQYPGNIIIAQEVPVNNKIHMGKVVPVELMPPVETKIASV